MSAVTATSNNSTIMANGGAASSSTTTTTTTTAANKRKYGMGLEISRVLSDVSHYRSFLCGFCQNVLNLDAVVVKPDGKDNNNNNNNNKKTKTPLGYYCNYCWKQQQKQQPSSKSSSSPLVESLESSQPLAYQCLTLIQVACWLDQQQSQQQQQQQQQSQQQQSQQQQSQPNGGESRSFGCNWTGNYGDFPQHLLSCPNAAGFAIQKPLLRTQSMPSLFTPLTNIALKFDPESLDLMSGDAVTPLPLRLPLDTNHLLLSDSSASPLVVFSMTPSSSVGSFSPDQHQLRKHHSFHEHRMAKTATAMTSSYFNPSHSTDGATTRDMLPPPPSRLLSPPHQQNNNNASSQRDVPPNLVRRTKSSDPQNLLGPNEAPNNLDKNEPIVNRNTYKPVPEEKRLRKVQRKPSSFAPVENDDEDENDDDPVWTSINSMTAWGAMGTSLNTINNLATMMPKDTVKSTDEEEDNENISIPETARNISIPKSSISRGSNQEMDREKMASIMVKAEKLKKQANAKFNKGDFTAARQLYSDGIKTMAAIGRLILQGPKDPSFTTASEMFSNMHSNRAVTYFREKEFHRCIQDCDTALRYDPLYEKSWIRKWRALMALGECQAAFDCLEKGLAELPDSAKIKKEFQKAQNEIDMIQKAKDWLERGEYALVKDLLHSSTKNFNNTTIDSNIAIWHLAARADAYLGYMESSLEKINRALRYNPDQAEGLATRGLIMYLAGETEKGLHLLQDANTRDKENKTIKSELQQCQRTHTSLSKGRSCVKRGRYLEAVEHFSSAMKDKAYVPEKTPLYAMVRCERAEAWMLSQNYSRALQDCQDVVTAQPQNSAAWAIRAEILIAMDKAQDAQKELLNIRKTWGMDDPIIEEGYRRVDFELRVLKADQELTSFVTSLEQKTIRIPSLSPSTSSGRDRRSSHRSPNRGSSAGSRGSHRRRGSVGSTGSETLQKEQQQRRMLRKKGPERRASSSSIAVLERTEQPKLRKSKSSHRLMSSVERSSRMRESSTTSPPSKEKSEKSRKDPPRKKSVERRNSSRHSLVENKTSRKSGDETNGGVKRV